MTRVLSAIGFATLAALPAASAAPVQVPYSGAISIDGGRDASVDIAVRIYDAASNGNRVWPPAGVEALFAAVPLRGGRFSLTLGDTGNGRPALDSALFEDPARTLWLELEVGRTGAARVSLSPRQRLLAVPVAAEIIGGAAIRGVMSWRIDGRLTAAAGIALERDGNFGSSQQPEEIGTRVAWAGHPTSQSAHAICRGGGAQPNGCGDGPAVNSVAIGFAAPPSARAVEACFNLNVQTSGVACGDFNLMLARTNPSDAAVIERGTPHQFTNINGTILRPVKLCDTFQTTPGAETVIRLMRWQAFNGCGAASLEATRGLRVVVRPLL